MNGDFNELHRKGLLATSVCGQWKRLKNISFVVHHQAGRRSDGDQMIKNSKAHKAPKQRMDVLPQSLSKLDKFYQDLSGVCSVPALFSLLPQHC